MASPLPAAPSPLGRSRSGGAKTPLKSPLGRTLLNDDDAEKERAAKARAANELRRRLDGGRENELPSGAAKACAGKAGEPAPRPVATLSTVQVLDLYSNCIKLASENKINAKNTWSLALIDHLSDLVKAEKDDDTSTNFQKASCTLDAGVKIYASRVDSVHSETFKVLGGLSRGAAARLNDAEGDEGHESGDEDAEDAEGDDGKQRARGATRRGAAASTLEAPALHTSRALEEAIVVDPLFQKTSAQFDEGGASGLLMNALSVHRGCDTVFDSNETPDFEGLAAASAPAALADLALDLSALAPTLAAATTALAASSLAAPLRLTPTLTSIRALLPGGAVDSSSSATGANATDVMAARDMWAADGMFACTPSVGDGAAHAGSMAALATSTAVDDDYYAGADGDTDGFYGGGGDLSDGDDENVVGGDDGAVVQQRVSGARGGPLALGRLQAGDNGVLRWVAAAADASGARQRRAWAGASHWRFGTAPAPAAPTSDDRSAAVVPRKSTKKAGPFFIDFTAPLKPLDEKLFQAPAKRTETLLAGAPTPADTLLPADLHYAPVQLVRLFLKPSAVLGASLASSVGDGAHCGDGATHFASSPCADDDDGAYDVADGGWDAFGGGAGADEPDAEAHAVDAVVDGSLVAAPRRVEQIRVNYARSAKVVDVRALKQALWSGLSDDHAPAAEHSFQTLLDSVSPQSGAGALSDLSVHMCFICVLHLANEHGLAIKGVPALDDMRITHDARM